MVSSNCRCCRRFFTRLEQLSTTTLQYTQRGPSQRSGPPISLRPRTTQISWSLNDPRASLEESLRICILARIPLSRIKLTFINVYGGIVRNSRLGNGRNSAEYGNVFWLSVLALYLLVEENKKSLKIVMFDFQESLVNRSQELEKKREHSRI